MFWEPCHGCDVAHCLQNSGERIEPLIAAKGFKWYEIDGEVNGREYVGTVLLCPKHVKEMETFIAARGRGEQPHGLMFKSFKGNRQKEPEYA